MALWPVCPLLFVVQIGIAFRQNAALLKYSQNGCLWCFIEHLSESGISVCELTIMCKRRIQNTNATTDEVRRC